jgi:hypothetical protein
MNRHHLAAITLGFGLPSSVQVTAQADGRYHARLSITGEKQETLIAIDVLIQPGPKMMEEAEKWNARMREQSPEGFELDEEHAPHVTLIQRFVAKSDLPSVLASVEKVKSKFDMSSLEMTATGLYHIPAGKIGLAGIVIESSEPLLKLQREVIEAVNVYARTGGGESAFVPDQSGTSFDPLLSEWRPSDGWRSWKKSLSTD